MATRISAVPLVVLLSSSVAFAQSLTLQSANPAGLPVSGANGSISQDGRFVLLVSSSTQMLPNDLGGFPDAFLRDRLNGDVQLVSPNTAGGFANGGVVTATLSANGRSIAFASAASDHVVGDVNPFADVFAAERTTLPAIELISVSTSGVQANGYCYVPAPSFDGRFVVFASAATNLVSGDTNAVDDVFLRDRQLGTTRLLSQSALGVVGNGASSRPAISDDGRFVAFQSLASNLVTSDTNGTIEDIFVHEVATGAITLASIGAGGVQGSWWSRFPRLSADGRYLVYTTRASELTGLPTATIDQIVLHDRALGQNELASVDSLGQAADARCTTGYVSADGQRVVFSSQADNLGGGVSGTFDVFLRNRTAQTTTLCSADIGGQPIAADSFATALTSDGEQLVMASDGALVPPDNNSVSDVFLLDFATAPPHVTRYCTAKTTSGGCVPTIGANGEPHATGYDSFFVFAKVIPAQKSAILFWGRQPTGVPFGGGTLCVAPPSIRTPARSTGGFSGCSGNISFHFRQSYMTLQGILPGDSIYAQFWFRDPGFSPPDNMGLTDAIEFVVLP